MNNYGQSPDTSLCLVDLVKYIIMPIRAQTLGAKFDNNYLGDLYDSKLSLSSLL